MVKQSGITIELTRLIQLSRLTSELENCSIMLSRQLVSSRAGVAQSRRNNKSSLDQCPQKLAKSYDFLRPRKQKRRKPTDACRSVSWLMGSIWTQFCQSRWSCIWTNPMRYPWVSLSLIQSSATLWFRSTTPARRWRKVCKVVTCCTSKIHS